MEIPGYLKGFQKVLFEDEIIEFTARQRRIGPGGSIFSPGVVVATNRRLIIIHDMLQLHIQEDVDVIPYNTITYVKLQHSVMSSTIIIGILGFTGAKELNPESSTSMMQIPGLRYDDAMTLVRITEKMLIKNLEQRRVTENTRPSETKEVEVKAEVLVLCNTCHARNPSNAKYCVNCGAKL